MLPCEQISEWRRHQSICDSLSFVVVDERETCGLGAQAVEYVVEIVDKSLREMTWEVHEKKRRLVAVSWAA